MLIRASGTQKNGDEVGFWVRATSSFQRLDNGWLITHEHVSLPVDLARGSAVTDQLGKLDAALVPEPGLRVMEFGVDRRRYRELKTRLSESVAAALA